MNMRKVEPRRFRWRIIMYRAATIQNPMADFFQKLEQKYGAGGPQFLSDHPNPGNRQASIQAEIRSWRRKSTPTQRFIHSR